MSVGTPNSYKADILDQPRAIRDTLSGLSDSPDLQRLATRLRRGDFQQIVLTGMGSSLTALMPLQLRLLQLGFPALCVETSELIHFQQAWLSSKTLLVAASQSGASAEILSLLSANSKRAPVIGITNTAKSPLGRGSDCALYLAAGPEASVACKTYTATLAAAAWLGETMGGLPTNLLFEALDQAANSIGHYAAHIDRHAAELGTLFKPERMTFFTGRGPSLATALTAGLIVKEATGCAAEGMSGAAFRHGPLELSGPGLQMMAFGGSTGTAILQNKLVSEISRHGARALVCGPESPFDSLRLPYLAEAALPLAEILPVQALTLVLSQASGREAGKFRISSKVTSIE